jgi:acetyltransferase-like isoleucine patch superfamily enzyme
VRILINRLRNRAARYLVAKRCNLIVAESAKVNYLGIRKRPPATLNIGEGSIFEGAITSDRAGSRVTIGNHTFIGNSTIVTALSVDIGDDVLMSWGCTIVDHDSHGLDWLERKNDVRGFYQGVKDWATVQIKPVKIGDKVWIGFNVIVLKGVTIGEGAVVGAGSVVTRDIEPYSLVAGNPAKFIRSLAKDDRGR